MLKIGLQRIQSLLSLRYKLALAFGLLFSQQIWAAQDALVVSDKAIIYSDQSMTSPIGFVRRGKKLRIGSQTKNQSQVYPIIVSGKIAYIKLVDVTTETESADSPRLVAERFREATVERLNTRYALDYYYFPSTIKSSATKDLPEDNLNWNGVSLRGEVFHEEVWGIEALLNYMQASVNVETFRAFEVGLGGNYRFLEYRKLEGRMGLQVLGIPFGNYSYGSDFRINGYGYTLGAGAGLSLKLTRKLGIEGFGGLYRTLLGGFDVPGKNKKVDLTFTGMRLGLGLNYAF